MVEIDRLRLSGIRLPFCDEVTLHYLENPQNDNDMVLIRKNNNDAYPYLAICGQQGYVARKTRKKLTDYAGGEIVVLAETPNAIIPYNWLRERGCSEVNQIV